MYKKLHILLIVPCSQQQRMTKLSIFQANLEILDKWCQSGWKYKIQIQSKLIKKVSWYLTLLFNINAVKNCHGETERDGLYNGWYLVTMISLSSLLFLSVYFYIYSHLWFPLKGILLGHISLTSSLEQCLIALYFY